MFFFDQFQPEKFLLSLAAPLALELGIKLRLNGIPPDVKPGFLNFFEHPFHEGLMVGDDLDLAVVDQPAVEQS